MAMDPPASTRTPSRLATIILFAGIASFAALYLASIGPYWNISPDSASYVEAARSLAAGAGWGAERFEPPVTALAFALVLKILPTGYTALNALTPLLILTSLGCAYALLRRRGHRNQALLAILLSLAAVSLYRATTQLLSEPVYMVFSLAALLVIEGYPKSEAIKPADAPRQMGLRAWVAGALLVASALTRTIGLALAIAVLLVEGLAWVRRQRRPSLGLAGGALVALASVPLWQSLIGSSYNRVWFGAFFLRDPWTPAAGTLSVTEFLALIRDNLALLPRAGGMLLNGWSVGPPPVQLFLQAAGTGVIAWGLLLALRRRIGVTEVYVGLSLLVIAAHMLFGRDSDYRFLVPVAPFLFYYALDAVRHAGGILARARYGRGVVVLFAILGAIWLFGYLRRGWDRATEGVAEAHYSPFGDYPIKRPENFDLQRLALWLRLRSQPEDRFASTQRDMIQVLSERRGDDIVIGLLYQREAFLAQLEQRQVRFLLLDRGIPVIRDSLSALVAAYPGSFRPVWELPAASLYEVRR